MTTPSNAMPDSPLESQGVASQASASAALAATRPLYWSIRRELWENRSIYIAPLAAAAVGMLAFLISLFGLPRSMRAPAEAGAMNHFTQFSAADRQRIMLAMPYSHVAWLLLLTAFIVGIFYSLDALHGERRDRSILFWKSLPVSDLTTVLAKASIPLVVLPVLVFAITVAVQLVMWLMSTAVLLMSGVGVSTLWTQLPLFQMELVLLYGLIVLSLWHAPIYAWLLLVSGWARRAAFLWAVLPLLAVAAFERIAFRTSYFASLLHYRLGGFAPNAFAFKTPDGVPIDPHFIPLAQLTPGKFLSTPALWLGLIFAAAFLAAAVRLRRYREPI
jgi:ABC-2 type transport system permease protein